MGEIIAVSMNKGGVGKTSLVANLSGAMGKQGDKKVLMVDTDGQGNLSLAFGLNPNQYDNTLYEVLMEECTPQEAIIKLDYGVDILPANDSMNMWEIEVLKNYQNYDDPFKLLKNALDGIRNTYDYIFIDTPPSIGLVTGNALVCADKVLIPFVAETFAVNGLVRLVEVIEDFKPQNPNLSILGVVGMMVKSGTVLHSTLLPKARQWCVQNGINMYDTVITDSVRFASATEDAGKPATWTEYNNKMVSAYYELMGEIFEYDKTK